MSVWVGAGVYLIVSGDVRDVIYCGIRLTRIA